MENALAQEGEFSAAKVRGNCVASIGLPT
jgi:hypothetical protein